MIFDRDVDMTLCQGFSGTNFEVEELNSEE